ncbi:putative Histidine kinase [Candidatus Sulfobium mesophilum]|uniref:histidine kinase n=1 Tax=Candidatus Sulfobium mesophilum TaxID=2016548 RepID=A0A2U3QI05_9BACT|nr:putative Histidine kinase [Candidatus Sulfobium mesophilum]
MGVGSNAKSSPLFDTLDCLNIPAFAIDEQMLIISSNITTSSVFQYSPGDMAGRDISEFICLNSVETGADLRSSEWAGCFENAEGNVSRFDAVCQKKNSDTFIAEVYLIPQQTGGIRLAVIRDVSDQRRLRQRAAQRTKELSIFNTFASILTSHSDAVLIMNETIEMLLSMMEADAGWIYLMDDETAELTLKAQRGFSRKFEEDAGKLKPGECFTGKVFVSGRSLLVKSAADDPRVSHLPPEIQSMAGVPISSRGVIMGVLGIGSRELSYFTAMDTQLLSTIGSQLGVALENTKLIGQLQEKMKQIELISELSGIINSSLSIGTIFRIMVSEIKKLVGYSRASLLLFNEKGNNLIIFALDTEMKTAMKKGVRAPLQGTSAGWVTINNRPWINRDLADPAFPLDRKLYNEGIRSTISIPLFHDKVLGVFNLDSTEPNHYSEKDLGVLLQAAKHISVALENALLFEEVSREKKEWEKTFDAITDMVWIEDGRQRVIRANQTLLAKTGFSSMDIAGMQCWDILERIGISGSGCLCSETMSRKKPSFRELKGHSAGVFHFWAYPLIDEEGKIYAIVHYLKDVTGQKRLEQQLIRSDRLASLGTLVAGVAHEINNPLSIIAGYSEALIDRAEDKALLANKEFEDFPEYLRTIHNEIFRCKDILRSLLDFARPSYGAFREIDINELIKEVILLVNHKAKHLQHNIELKLNRELPKIHADPGSLRQLFMNIIINSIYFTPERGRVIIRSEEDKVGEFDPGPCRIKVSVSDTGKGIPRGLINKVFDPFFTTKPVGEGTGLGLAICHKIVEEHGGNIDIESEDGEGTTLIIRLPTNARVDKSIGS